MQDILAATWDSNNVECSTSWSFWFIAGCRLTVGSQLHHVQFYRTLWDVQHVSALMTSTQGCLSSASHYFKMGSHGRPSVTPCVWRLQHGRSQNTEKVSYTKGRLLHQAMIQASIFTLTLTYFEDKSKSKKRVSVSKVFALFNWSSVGYIWPTICSK